VTLKDGARETVSVQAETEETELMHLLTRSGQPYNSGWIEIVVPERTRGRKLISYDAVASVELEPDGPGT
jgi:hypothetical protein